MSTPHKPDSPSSAGDDRNLVTIDENYLAPTFEDRLRIFWEKNSRAIVVGCVLVVLVILGKGAYEITVAQRERAVAADFAAASSAEGDDALNFFVASHGDHVLGGLAQLALADRAYSAGNYTGARGSYEKAAGILKKNPFGQRARLGAAISALQAGATAEGETALNEIVSDLALDKLVRSEAAYHLASRAAEAGNHAEAIRFIEQSTVIDPEGHWADRASMLRSTLPVPEAADASAAGTAPAAAEDGNVTEEAPTVRFN